MIYFYSSPNILDINLCIQLTHNYRHSIKMLLLATTGCLEYTDTTNMLLPVTIKLIQGQE